MWETADRRESLESDAPRLLLAVYEPDARRRHLVAGTGAVCVHAVLIGLALWAPAGRRAAGPEAGVDIRRSTPLVAPPEPFRLTQKEPQRGKPAAEVDMAALLARPALRAPAWRGGGRPFVPPPGAAREEASVVRELEAPKIEVGQAAPLAPPPALAQGLAAPPPPAKGRNPFESVGGPQPPGGEGRVAAPSERVEDAVKSVVRGGGGSGVIVGDAPGPGGAVSEGVAQNPRAGRNASTLELLSDARGVDFRPYLIQVLAAVRRNWQAVIPESARFGQRGRVAIQFIINRQGQVPKLVIAVPSGTEALDRAAVAGISASNPFPPLPAEFRGEEIRLQLVFSYNMPR